MGRVVGALLFFLFCSPACWAQSNASPFDVETKWNVRESWNKDKLVYTFRPDGTFQSSTNKRGVWMREGSSFVMVWPQFDNVVYVGTVSSDHIHGSGFLKTGKSFGTFDLELMR